MADLHRFVRKVLLATGIIGLVYAIPAFYFNVVVDPYGVFHADASYPAAVPNERIVKMRHVLTHPDRYDVFIFGNSRVNQLSSRGVAGRPYNFFLTAGTPQEHLAAVRMMLDRGVNVRQVVLGVDEATYTSDPSVNHRRLSSIGYPSDGRFLSLYATYAFNVPDPGVITEAFHPREEIRYDYASSGHAFFVSRERWIDGHLADHVLQVEGTELYPSRFTDMPRMDAALQAIRDLQALCEQRGISLTVFVNPVSTLLLRIQDAVAYRTFLKRLADVTEYVDFGGVNAYTSDLTNYYEYSHYRPKVGEAMADILWGGVSSSVPGFGVRITPQNVEAHLQVLDAQLKSLSQ